MLIRPAAAKHLPLQKAEALQNETIMKQVLCFVFLLLVFECAYPQQKVTAGITAIGFEMFGRRGKNECLIVPGTVTDSGRLGKRKATISRQQWNELVNAIKQLNLKTIHKLKSPTSQRDVDGALHCRIMIRTKKKEYLSSYFDSGHPMKQLKKLYEKIEAIRNQLEEEE